MSRRPNQSPESSPQLDQGYHEVGSVYRLGDRTLSMDVVLANGGTRESYPRFYIWQDAGDDTVLAEPAGWAGYRGGEQDGYSYLNIPTGTRPARSVFGGVPAWPQEKHEIIGYLSGYIDKVNRLKPGYTDTSVSLDTIARTKDGYFFTLPPHNLTNDQDVIRDWSVEFREDIEAVLVTDEQMPDILSQFEKEVVEHLPSPRK